MFCIIFSVFMNKVSKKNKKTLLYGNNVVPVLYCQNHLRWHLTWISTWQKYHEKITIRDLQELQLDFSKALSSELFPGCHHSDIPIQCPFLQIRLNLEDSHFHHLKWTFQMPDFGLLDINVNRKLLHAIQVYCNFLRNTKHTFYILCSLCSYWNVATLCF